MRIAVGRRGQPSATHLDTESRYNDLSQTAHAFTLVERRAACWCRSATARTSLQSRLVAMHPRTLARSRQVTVKRFVNATEDLPIARHKS